MQGQTITINVDRNSSKGHLADVMASMSMADEDSARAASEGKCATPICSVTGHPWCPLMQQRKPK